MPRRFLGIFIALAAALPGQEATVEVRRTVADYVARQREGGGRHLSLQSKDFRLFLPNGHIFDQAPGVDPMAPRGRERAVHVVSVGFPRADVAIAAGVWRDGAAAPPLDAGAIDYTLVRESGTWKVAAWRETMLAGVGKAGELAALGEAWTPLFDGTSAAGWMGVDGTAGLPAPWRIENGELVMGGGAGGRSLRTVRRYESFELAWEWKGAAGANSGVKYRLFGLRLGADGRPVDAVGFEYQLVDEERDRYARTDPEQWSGALYGVIAPERKVTRAVGQWNESRIVVTRDRVEHFLNGVKTAQYPVDLPFASPIVLQHHTNEVRFRNLRIRGR